MFRKPLPNFGDNRIVPKTILIVRTINLIDFQKITLGKVLKRHTLMFAFMANNSMKCLN